MSKRRVCRECGKPARWASTVDGEVLRWCIRHAPAGSDYLKTAKDHAAAKVEKARSRAAEALTAKVCGQEQRRWRYGGGDKPKGWY